MVKIKNPFREKYVENTCRNRTDWSIAYQSLFQHDRRLIEAGYNFPDTQIIVQWFDYGWPPMEQRKQHVVTTPLLMVFCARYNIVGENQWHYTASARSFGAGPGQFLSIGKNLAAKEVWIARSNLYNDYID